MKHEFYPLDEIVHLATTTQNVKIHVICEIVKTWRTGYIRSMNTLDIDINEDYIYQKLHVC